MRSTYLFKQKEKGVEKHYKQLLFRRAFNMFNIYKTQKAF